jgi:hypothetical protein
MVEAQKKTVQTVNEIRVKTFASGLKPRCE